MKEPEWVVVYQSHEEYSVHIRKLKLESEGIPTMIFDQRDSSYNAFGFVFLHVPAQEEEHARKVLTETNE